MTYPYPVDPAKGIIDELQGWYVAKGEREGLVYTAALRLLVGELYIQRDYLARRKGEGKHTSYDYVVEQQVKAIAWAIQQLVLHVPQDIKDQPEPPKPSRALATKRTRGQGNHQAPNWNGQPKRDWEGPELPPEGLAPTPKPTRKSKEPT